MDPALAAVRAEHQPVGPVALQQLDFVTLVEEADLDPTQFVRDIEQSHDVVADEPSFSAIERPDQPTIERQPGRRGHVADRIRLALFEQRRPAPARQGRLRRRSARRARRPWRPRARSADRRRQLCWGPGRSEVSPARARLIAEGRLGGEDLVGCRRFAIAAPTPEDTEGHGGGDHAGRRDEGGASGRPGRVGPLQAQGGQRVPERSPALARAAAGPGAAGRDDRATVGAPGRIGRAGRATEHGRDRARWVTGQGVTAGVSDGDLAWVSQRGVAVGVATTASVGVGSTVGAGVGLRGRAAASRGRRRG